jgi:pyruvate-formate lyase
LWRALRIVKTGFGQPSIFNTDTIVKELMRQGKSAADAYDAGASGCVEAGAFGKENYTLTGYFNMPKVFEITLHNGVDPRTGNRPPSCPSLSATAWPRARIIIPAGPAITPTISRAWAWAR